MKPTPLLRRVWHWLPPQTWSEIYAVITVLLLGFLAVAYLLAWLKGTLP